MNNNPILLGVNIDHIATLRQVRGTVYPDPIQAGILAEAAGADHITVHLREDRRHIQDKDVEELKKALMTGLNFEMAATKEMIRFASIIHPAYCTLVPEKRQELTTEGGLDVIKNEKYIRDVCEKLKMSDIRVSLFIDPDLKQLEAALRCEVPIIEIHTGDYADAKDKEQREKELTRIKKMAQESKKAGLEVYAGHGLHYKNVQAIAKIPEITELNIGHSIIARSIFVGLKHAIEEMKQLMQECRN